MLALGEEFCVDNLNSLLAANGAVKMDTFLSDRRHGSEARRDTNRMVAV